MKNSLSTMIACVLIASMIVSCKKDKKEELDAKIQQHNEDASNFKSESDQINDDINNSVSETSIGNGRIAGYASSPLCGVTIDSSQIAHKILLYNFDGTSYCFSPSRTRSGQIKVQLTSGNIWGEANAVLTITYNNFKITRSSNGNFITFNGVKTLQNVNGNNWLAFLTGTGTLKYRERALNIAVGFKNQTTATWNSARITEWSYVPNTANPALAKIIFTAQGDTSLNGFSNVDAWGTNRYAQSFTTYYTSPIVSDTYCGLWRPNSGVLVHHLPGADYTLTLGVNTDGTPMQNGACGYGFRVNWTTSSGTPSEVILSY